MTRSTLRNDPENEEANPKAIDENGEPTTKPSLRPKRRKQARNPMTSRQKLTMLRKMTPMMTVRLKRPKSLRSASSESSEDNK